MVEEVVEEEAVEEEEEEEYDDDDSNLFVSTLDGMGPAECIQSVVTHFMGLLEGGDVKLSGGEKRQLKELKKAKDILFGLMEK